MKNLFILLFFLSSYAHASYYYTECSNNTGTVKIYRGHTGNTSTATSIGGHPSKPVKKLVKLSYKEYDFNYSDKVSIEHKNTSKCKDDVMYYSSKSIYAEKVIITKKDGSLFHKSIAGIASDRKSLPAYLICKNIVHSRPRPMKCPKD